MDYGHFLELIIRETDDDDDTGELADESSFSEDDGDDQCAPPVAKTDKNRRFLIPVKTDENEDHEDDLEYDYIDTDDVEDPGKVRAES
uniref:Uncharacterized protein n=1 Tax=Caenorhabditis japonica TaxID=281687 RepID=A0A8R1ES17_CAEJA